MIRTSLEYKFQQQHLLIFIWLTSFNWNGIFFQLKIPAGQSELNLTGMMIVSTEQMSSMGVGLNKSTQQQQKWPLFFFFFYL